MKKIFYTFLLVASLGLSLESYAWVVPGTIQKSGYTSGLSCNTSTSTYSPSGAGCSSYCSAGSWKSSSYSCNCTTSPVTCSGTPSVCTGGVTTCQTCTNTYWSCDTYRTTPTTWGSLSFTNYLYNSQSPTYASAGGSRKLSGDLGQSCSKWANGTSHTAPGSASGPSCDDGSSSYYVGGSNGTCNQYGSTDNLISAFDQYGSVTRSSPSDGDSTCTVEGRYASADDSGPNVSVGSVSAVFDNDQNNWCDMEKYSNEATYGTASNPLLTGCEYYRSKNPNITGSDPKSTDLLKGLEFTVNDTSGIASIDVEIGICSATYSLPTGVTSILTGSNGGLKGAYTNFTIRYNTSTDVDGNSLAGLLQKFGRTRLDSCFTEGKNYIKITARDNARSDSDGISFSPNTTTLDYSGQNKFVKTDTTTPKIKISGDASKFYESNTAASCFIGGATLDPNWKNYTISGSLQSGDPFGNNAADCSVQCNVLSGSTLSCAGSSNLSGVANIGGANPSDPIYASPAGINPTTGQFTGYTCDGLGPNPNTNSCDWGCKSGYVKDPATKTCIVAPGNIFILFDSWSIDASGPSAAKLDSGVSSSKGLLISESVSCTTPANASSSKKYKTYKYSAGAQYGPIGSLPAPYNTQKWAIAVSGETNCTPTCNDPLKYTATYGPTGGSCNSVQNFASCVRPTNYANAIWNTKWFVIQTWNGTAWTPALPATSYNDISGGDDNQCYFKCETGYIWDGSKCEPKIPGKCGTDNGAQLASSPTNLCKTGNPSSVSGSGPWTWSCNSPNGGTSESCGADKAVVVTPACGSDNGQPLWSAPSNLCSPGTATIVTDNGTNWTWSCNGSSGTASVSCSAIKYVAQYDRNVSMGEHSDIGGSWWWLDARPYSHSPYLFGRAGYGWVMEIQYGWGWVEWGSWVPMYQFNKTTNFDYKLCAPGYHPVQIGEEGIMSCPEGSSQYGGGCYYPNTDPRKPANCDGQDPADDCSFFVCIPGSIDPPAPVNGACSTTPGECSAGYVSVDNGSYFCGNDRQWTCSGRYGGSNASCTYVNSCYGGGWN